MYREQYGECRFWLMLGCRWQTYSSLTWEEEDCDKVLALCLRTDFLICFDPRFIKIAMDITKNNVNPTDIPMAALSVEVSPSRGYSDRKNNYKITLLQYNTRKQSLIWPTRVDRGTSQLLHQQTAQNRSLTLDEWLHLISPHKVTPESNIKVKRIEEMITNLRISWLSNQYSLWAAQEICRQQYGEDAIAVNSRRLFRFLCLALKIQHCSFVFNCVWENE